MRSIGIDVSKDKFDVCLKEAVGVGRSRVVASTKFGNDPEGIARFQAWVRSHKSGGALCVMEATGVYHENLLYALYDGGFQCAAVPPNRVHSFAKAENVRAKTDKSDAALIAEFGIKYRAEITPWEPCSANLRRIRCCSREVQAIDELLAALKNQLHALSRSVGIPADIMEAHEGLISAAEQAKARALECISELLGEDRVLRDKVALVTPIKGVTELTAARILSETNCFSGFPCARKATAYAGLNVTVHQSGQSSKRGHVSKAGNAHLRGLLYMPALCASLHEPVFTRARERILSRTAVKKKAIVAVMRRLLAVMYAVVKSGVPFDPGHRWAPTPRKRHAVATPHTRNEGPGTVPPLDKAPLKAAAFLTHLQR